MPRNTRWRALFDACLILPTLVACTPAAAPAQVAARSPFGQHGEPDALRRTEDPAPSTDAYHGHWRLLAASDPHDHALMGFTVQRGAGQTEDSSDYVLFQPFCDAVAGVPITGTSECELIDHAATFDRVQASREALSLSFHPTADGAQHRLELHRDGERLVGEYIADGGAIRLAVFAEPAPKDAR